MYQERDEWQSHPMYKCERETRWHAIAVCARIKQNRIGALSELKPSCFTAFRSVVSCTQSKMPRAALYIPTVY